MTVNTIEHKVMTALLFGDHPVLSILRKQYAAATVKARDFDSNGSFTRFVLPDDIARINGNPDFEIQDVIGQFEGLKQDVGFILFVRKGAIDFLESYTFVDEDNYSVDSVLQQLSYVFSYLHRFPYNTKLGRMFMRKPVNVEKKMRDWNELIKVLQPK